MTILGVSDSHDSSAVLLLPDGTLRGLEEERPTRIKNFHHIPRLAIEWLLDSSGLQPRDVDVVALASTRYFRPTDRAARIRQIREAGTWKGRARDVLRRSPVAPLYNAQANRRRRQLYRDLGFRAESIHTCDHHTCHAATALYGWGVHDRPVLVITCDGHGDGVCATVSIGEHGRLRRLFAVHESHSIATLYAVVTYLTGMVPNEHEYKVMGMAPYAALPAAQRVAGRLLALFEWDRAGRPLWRRRRGTPPTLISHGKLQRLFFEERFDAIMGGLQLFMETMLSELVRRAVRTTGIGHVALAGGAFMNVKANQAILAMDEVESLFVMPSCGDETTALGAVWLADAEKHGGAAVRPLRSLYLGPEWRDAEIERALQSFAAAGQITVEEPPEINQAVAECLVGGEVVGRFAGAEEFGARSLGNRALLADPRNYEVVRVINEMVKNRDFWMPFAPSILAEDADRYVVNRKRIAAPYMILSFDTTDEGATMLKAAIHPYDRTCRPQIVTREGNPAYWDLIRRFRAATGVGAVLNTSLNLHGYPLVHRPQDGLDLMMKSGLRRLALGRYLVTKVATEVAAQRPGPLSVPGREGRLAEPAATEVGQAP
jgi:carbamoyltransferase